MGSRLLHGFRFQVVLRALLLTGTLLLLLRFFSAGRPMTILFLGAAAALQVYGLIHYVETTNRWLRQFLESIEFGDLSQNVAPGPAGRSFGDLRATFGRILSRVREVHAAKEESLRYRDALVQHVGVGLVAFRREGRVEILNSAAKSLFNIASLRQIDDLSKVDPDLPGIFRSLRPGERDLATVRVGDELLQLSLRAAEIRHRGETVTVVAIQDIRPELREKEMEAWRNLIRVFTHEIKNSLTPIESLAASVEDLVAGEEALRGDGGERERIAEAMGIVRKRSRGLLRFVDTYRDLTHIPKPEFREFPVADLFSRLERLAEPQITGRGVSFRTAVRPEGMKLVGDPQLVEQVALNLIKNALEAVEGQENKEITVEARVDERSRPVLRVSDNGPGIEGKSLEEVFVPFYSTKKGGSGVGLSLSLQIMRLHRGDLTVTSEPGVRTTFTMRF